MLLLFSIFSIFSLVRYLKLSFFKITYSFFRWFLLFSTLEKKYGVYDENKDAKDVNYILNLEDDLSDFFRKKLISVFNIK